MHETMNLALFSDGARVYTSQALHAFFSYLFIHIVLPLAVHGFSFGSLSAHCMLIVRSVSASLIFPNSVSIYVPKKIRLIFQSFDSVTSFTESVKLRFRFSAI